MAEPTNSTLGDNPRYANYARAHGRTPDEQIEQDRKDWPGGCMVGFTQWNQAKIRAFSFVQPEAFLERHLVDHAAYDAWLTSTVDAIVRESAEKSAPAPGM